MATKSSTLWLHRSFSARTTTKRPLRKLRANGGLNRILNQASKQVGLFQHAHFDWPDLNASIYFSSFFLLTNLITTLLFTLFHVNFDCFQINEKQNTTKKNCKLVQKVHIDLEEHIERGDVVTTHTTNRRSSINWPSLDRHFHVLWNKNHSILLGSAEKGGRGERPRDIFQTTQFKSNLYLVF